MSLAQQLYSQNSMFQLLVIIYTYLSQKLWDNIRLDKFIRLKIFMKNLM